MKWLNEVPIRLNETKSWLNQEPQWIHNIPPDILTLAYVCIFVIIPIVIVFSCTSYLLFKEIKRVREPDKKEEQKAHNKPPPPEGCALRIEGIYLYDIRSVTLNKRTALLEVHGKNQDDRSIVVQSQDRKLIARFLREQRIGHNVYFKHNNTAVYKVTSSVNSSACYIFTQFSSHHKHDNAPLNMILTIHDGIHNVTLTNAEIQHYSNS